MIAEPEVYRALTPLFAEVFLRDDIVLAPELTARDVEGWDSFKQIEIIIAAEQRFRMKFTSRDIDGLRSLGDLVAIIALRGTVAA